MYKFLPGCTELCNPHILAPKLWVITVLPPSVSALARYGERFVFKQQHVTADPNLQSLCLDTLRTCTKADCRQSANLLSTKLGSTAVTNWGNTDSRRYSGYSFVTLLIVTNHNVHHHIHNSPSLVSTPSQINPVHTPPPTSHPYLIQLHSSRIPGLNPVGTRFSARPDRPWGPPSLM